MAQDTDGKRPEGIDLKDSQILLNLYQEAVRARNFHYENFSKWQTFFYVAIGAVLVAYCTTAFPDTDCGCGNAAECVDDARRILLARLLSVLGYVFSLIWLCSSRGYTYWWNAYAKNLREFERHHILNDRNEEFGVYDFLRDRFRGSVIFMTHGANFSTSRLANALAFVSASAWGVVIAFDFAVPACRAEQTAAILTPICLTWLAAVPVMNLFFDSDLSDFKGTRDCDALRVCQSGCLAVFSFILIGAFVSLLFLFICPNDAASIRILICFEIWILAAWLLFLLLRKFQKYLF